MTDAYVHNSDVVEKFLPIRTLVVRSVFLELTGSRDITPNINVGANSVELRSDRRHREI